MTSHISLNVAAPTSNDYQNKKIKKNKIIIHVRTALKSATKAVTTLQDIKAYEAHSNKTI